MLELNAVITDSDGLSECRKCRNERMQQRREELKNVQRYCTNCKNPLKLGTTSCYCSFKCQLARKGMSEQKKSILKAKRNAVLFALYDKLENESLPWRKLEIRQEIEVFIRDNPL